MARGERIGRGRRPEVWRCTPLWRALEAMRIGPEGAALGFVARLARENGWSEAHADAVVGEYRRFLYLAATGGPVTPSEDVDQAWHLHLTYSRHYWEVLCGAVLKRPLHHEPTSGGPSEAARYRAHYEATLARYRAMFGVAPPAAIWPGSVERFAARPLRIDTARYWLVPRAVPGVAGALAAAGLLAACTASAGSDALGVLLGLAALIAMGIAMVMVLAGHRANNRKDGGGGACGGGSGSGSADGPCGGDGGGGGGCGG